nr:universal stress protein [Microlunatus panaciterrae]
MVRNEIVVGIDDSASARAAMHWAAEYARTANLHLRAMNVYADRPEAERVWTRGFPAQDLEPVPAVEYEDPEVQRVFDSVNPRASWSLEYAQGDPGEVLVQQSHHARMLVIGTREHTGIGRLRSGSVSHHCLSHATCPVVAVPDHRLEEQAKEDRPVAESTL